jgi:uncharacterized membrane protein
MAALSKTSPMPGQPVAAGMAAGSHIRLSAVDHLRGLVMVLMVLDHSREFFMNSQVDPTNLATTYPLLFFTRWVTHFCAPVFVFLAGTGAFLTLARGKPKRELSLFLLTRGLWLMLLEVTLVKLGWMFRYDSSLFLIQVIWVIGASMVLLSGLVYLPLPVIGAIGLVIVAGHNIFDSGEPAKWLMRQGWMATLMRPGVVKPVQGTTAIMAYSLIPWLGVMMCGYAFGSLLLRPHHQRRRLIFALGATMTLTLLVLRALNGYGDPLHWSSQSGWGMTIISFLNCQKYPPSLLFLLMTLGPALMLLAWFDRGTGIVGQMLVTLGRVPLFFYLIQWPVVHLLAVLLAAVRGEPVAWLFGDAPFSSPPTYGHGLATVYLAWAVALVLLYVPCRWFGGVKQSRHDWWLSYL